MPTSIEQQPVTRAMVGEYVLLVTGAVLGAALWFGTRGAPPNRPGAIVDMAITLVAADATELACALPERIGPGHCEYKQPSEPWAARGNRPRADDVVLAPYAATDGSQVILGGVFAQPAVARRAAVDSSLPRARQKRFVADCKIRLLEPRAKVPVRFGRSAAWGHFDRAWIGVAESCTVHD